MIVVSNSSPLIALAKIGEFNLLHSLYEELSIPQAVREEVVVIGDNPYDKNRPGSEELIRSSSRKRQILYSF